MPRTIWVVIVSIFSLLPFAGCVQDADHVLPAEIQDLEMGASQMEVVKRLLPGGQVSRLEGRRPRIFWQTPKKSRYEKAEFRFTESDRLFLIRLSLRHSARDEYQSLKKQFFKTYNMSWEDPLRMSREEYDTSLYAPEKGDIFFLEWTHKKSGNKLVELFNKKVSGGDREVYAEEQKKAKEAADKETQSGSQTNEKSGPHVQPEEPGGVSAAEPSVTPADTVNGSGNAATLPDVSQQAF